MNGDEITVNLKKYRMVNGQWFEIQPGTPITTETKCSCQGSCPCSPCNNCPWRNWQPLPYQPYVPPYTPTWPPYPQNPMWPQVWYSTGTNTPILWK